MVPIHNNLLYTTSSSVYDWGGGSSVNRIVKGDNTSNYCIDTEISWTQVCKDYGGIKVDAVLSSFHWGSQPSEFIWGAYGPQGGGDFYFLTPGPQNINPVWCFYNRVYTAEITSNESPTIITSSVALIPTGSNNNWTVTLEIWKENNILLGSDTKTGFMSFPNTVGKGTHICLFTPVTNLNSTDRKDVNIYTRYEGLKIFGYGGSNETLLFDGVPWKDVNDVGCFKDLLTGRIFYNLLSGTIIYG